MQLFHGNIVYSVSERELAEHTDSYIAVENGTVEGIYPVIPEKLGGAPVTDLGDGVIIPAFSDLHVHAPQYPQRGLAMDELLYDWLHKYTFPLEARFADMEFARAVYDAFIDDMILHGTMHAAVFGTIHREAAGYLISRMEEKGLYAYVGKVNMDTDSPEYLCETAEDSVRETEVFLEQYSANRTAKPVLTPRFALPAAVSSFRDSESSAQNTASAFRRTWWNRCGRPRRQRSISRTAAVIPKYMKKPVFLITGR